MNPIVARSGSQRPSSDNGITADHAIRALTPEVLRLRQQYGADLGRPYLAWRNRLRALMGYGPEYEMAFQMLLRLYETGDIS